MNNTPEQKPEAASKGGLFKFEDKKELEKSLIGTVLRPLAMFVGLPMAFLPIVGGGIVLATTTAALPVLAGVGAVASGLYGVYGIAKILPPGILEKKIEEVFNKFEKDKDAKSAALPKPVKDGKYFARAALSLAFSAAKLGTSVALFSVVAATSGFAAFAVGSLGVWLGVTGGLGTLVGAGKIVSDIKKKIEHAMLKDLPKEEMTVAKIAPDLSPAPTLSSAEAGKNFNESAPKDATNDNVSKAPAAKPASLLRPPAA